MNKTTQSGVTQTGSGIQIEVGNVQECWKLLAALVAKRAHAIFGRRAAAREEGPEIWQLAESQIEKPLCCGLLRLTGGWLISFNSAEMACAQIKVCAEPRRLIILGTNPPTGAAGAKDAAVRVLKLPNEVDPKSLSFRAHGPVIDVELHDRLPAQAQAATAA